MRIFKRTVLQGQKGKGLLYFPLSECVHMNISCTYLNFLLPFCHSVILKTCLHNSLSPTAIKIGKIKESVQLRESGVPSSLLRKKGRYIADVKEDDSFLN